MFALFHGNKLWLIKVQAYLEIHFPNHVLVFATDSSYPGMDEATEL